MTSIKNFNKKYYLLPIVACVLTLMACQKTDSETPNIVENEETELVQKKVFLEYFTGHKCGNCPPNAGKAITEIKATHQENVVVMTIHSGFFSIPNSGAPGSAFTYDFRTQEGNAIDSTYGVTITGTPKGMLNRKEVNESRILTPSVWNDAIDNILAEKSPIQVEMSSSQSNNTFEGNIAITTLQKLTSSHIIELYLTETNISNWQRDYSTNPEDIPNYIHQYVLRAQVDIPNNILDNSAVNEITNVPFSLELPSEFVAENCQLIAVIRNSTSGEVVQCEEVKLK